MKTFANERDRRELMERLRNVKSDSARRWGRMTAPQMICHLTDVFKMLADRKPASPATGVPQRTVIKWIALYTPLPWPKGIRTRPELDQEFGGTKPSDFACDVGEFEAVAARVIAQIGTFDGRVHPIFGPLTEVEWLRWAYLHVDHHLRQFGA